MISEKAVMANDTSMSSCSSSTLSKTTFADNGDCVAMDMGLKMECITMEPIVIDIKTEVQEEVLKDEIKEEVKEEVKEEAEEVEDCGVTISLGAEGYAQVKSESVSRDDRHDSQVNVGKNCKQISFHKFAMQNSTAVKCQCSLCGKLFKDASYLAHHIILIHVHTRCKCSVCGKWYLNAAFLAKHKVSHSQPTENHCTKHNDYDDPDNSGANERDRDMGYDVLKERTKSCVPPGPGRTVVEIAPVEQVSVGNAKRKSTRLKESRNGDQDYEIYIKTEDYHDDGGDYSEEGGDYSEGGRDYHKVGYSHQLPLDEGKDSESNVPRIVQGRMEEADDFKKSYTTKNVAKNTDFRKSDPQSESHDDHDDGSDPEDETPTDARYRCKTCNQKFVSSRDLAKHSRMNHNDPIRCSVCNKVFTLKCTLTRHMMLHTGEKRYSCQSCDQKFFRRTDLERHMIKCHGAKKFECDICGSGFYTRTYLIVHRKSHFDTYSWQCKLCEKMFKHQRYLKKHVTVIHSDSRPFECSFCKKCFKEKRNLDLHLRIHSDEKAYPCELCEKRYRTKGHLNDHQIAKHGFKPRWMKEMLC